MQAFALSGSGHLLTLELSEGAAAASCRIRHRRPARLPLPDEAAAVACMRGYALLASSAGAAVFNVSGSVSRPGLQEVAMASVDDIARSSGLTLQVRPPEHSSTLCWMK